MKKLIGLSILFFAVFVGSMGFNIFMHELGHFAVAEAYDSNPEMHFMPDGVSVNAFYTADSKIAYVSYDSDTVDITQQDVKIAMAGPLVNLLLGSLGMLLYLSPKRSDLSKMLLILLIVPSYVSFVINIIPISPSDGFYLFQYLV